MRQVHDTTATVLSAGKGPPTVHIQNRADPQRGVRLDTIQHYRHILCSIRPADLWEWFADAASPQMFQVWEWRPRRL